MGKYKDKERIVKKGKKKQQVTYKGSMIRLPADFSMATI